MKQLREQIRKELKTLMEKEMRSYPIPGYIENALENNLKLFPLKRYVATTKAVASVPPSYRIFFHNNQFIDLYVSIEPPFDEKEPGIKAIIKNRSFFPIDDVREANEAIALLNREVLTAPTPVSSGDETSTDTGDDTVTEPDEPTEEPEV